MNLQKVAESKHLDLNYLTSVMQREIPKFVEWMPFNADKAFNLFLKNKDKKFCVYFDPDVDGLFSGVDTCSFLDLLGIDYITVINEGRFHGFNKDNIIKLTEAGVECIICVDFFISQEDIQEIAKSFDIIVMDHHEVGDIQLGEHYVTINNQYSNEPVEMRCLSGTGVVFYTLLSFARMMKSNTVIKECSSIERLIHVGISLLSDMREVENYPSYFFLYNTYNNNYTGFLQKFCKDSYNFGLDVIDRSFIDFKLSPCINALFRFGEANMAVNIFKNKLENAIDFVLAEGKLQSKIIYDLTLAVDENILELDDMVIGFLNETPMYYKKYKRELFLPNFTGLVANRLTQKYKKLALVITKLSDTVFTAVTSGEDLFKCSVRCKYKLDYLNLFRKYMDANGHKNAFGAFFTEQVNLQAISNDVHELEFVQRELEKHYQDDSILYSENLAFTCKNINLEEIGYLNNYLRSEKMFRIAFTSNNIEVLKHTEKYILVEIDGISVQGFFIDDISKVKFIVPNNVKGFLQLYLE